MNVSAVSRMLKLKPSAAAVHQLLSTATITAAAAGPLPVKAQESLDEIIVTGTRIPPNRNLVASSPVTVIQAEELRRLGITRVEDLVNDLPSVTPERTANEAGGATGTATIDLRGLGSDRTLVLTNGHRMGFGDPFALAPDINQVPGALIERIEVLTGGASSTYGSDAIAGVVNFVMKRNFEGVQLDYQYSAYQHNQHDESARMRLDANGIAQPPVNVWDGGTHDVNVSLGVRTPDDRGSIVAYLGYRDINAVTQSQRDFSACPLGTTGGVSCEGSPTIPSGLFVPFGAANFFTVEGEQFIDWLTTGPALYNFAPTNHFQRPDKRYTGGAFGHYKMNDHLNTYTEIQFMDDRSLAQIAPSGAFLMPVTLNCDNPLLSAQQTSAIAAAGHPCIPGNGDVVPFYIGRRSVESGPRIDDLRHTSYRILAGVKGDITEHWSYDAFANFSRLVYGEIYHNDLSSVRIRRSLDVVTGPGGRPTCRSVIDGSDPSCVPWNIFEEGQVTQKAVDYLRLALFSNADLTQDQYVAFISGDLGNMSSIRRLQVVLGAEYRDQGFDFNPGEGFTRGEAAGQGSPTLPVAGQLNVTEFFFEAKVPLVWNRRWADALTADVGYRFSDYSTGVSTDTYKASGSWTINSDVKLRGGYHRAVRHANIRELFEPLRPGGWSGIDPCEGTTPAHTLAQCRNSGVTPAQYGNIPPSPFGYNAKFGGNPDLDPETSNSFSMGAVITPRVLPGFTLSVDYWRIEVEDAIDVVEPGFIVNQCGLTGAAVFCSLINRGPNGSLWLGSTPHVLSTETNIGFFRTSGVDIFSSYNRDAGSYGVVDFSFRGTWLEDYEQQAVPGTLIEECGGFYGGGCGRPRPEWKHAFNAVWTTPWNVSVSGTWRHIGSVDEFERDRFSAGAENYLDLAVEYSPGFIRFGEITMRMGVRNVTDNDPPVSGIFRNVSVFGNGNTIPGTWDALGRYFFFGVTARF